MIIEDKSYSLEDVFNMIGEERLLRVDDDWKKKDSIVVDGFDVYPVSLRYMLSVSYTHLDVYKRQG